MSAKGNREQGADVGRVSFVDMGVPEPLGNGNAAVFLPTSLGTQWPSEARGRVARGLFRFNTIRKYV